MTVLTYCSRDASDAVQIRNDASNEDGRTTRVVVVKEEEESPINTYGSPSSFVSLCSERPVVHRNEEQRRGLLSSFSESITKPKRAFLSWSNRPISKDGSGVIMIDEPIEAPDLERMRRRRQRRVVAVGIASGVGCTLALGPLVGVAIGVGAGLGAAKVGKRIGNYREQRELKNYRSSVVEQLQKRKYQRSVEQLNSQIHNLPPVPYQPTEDS